MENLILATDSYKVSHKGGPDKNLYPPEVTGLYSYIESRGGLYDSVLMFGLQYALKKYLSKPITLEDINEAEAFMSLHGEPFNREGWEKVDTIYGGFIPVTINAVPEGTLVPTHVPMVTVSCEDPDLFWLTSYIETWLLRSVWFPSTVATRSFMCKRIIKEYLDKTGDPSGLLFKLHDFSGRGGSSQETEGIGGTAHLVNFLGTDTLEALWYARKYYGSEMAGFSIPALEHSITTAWGRDREVECMRNALEIYGGQGKLLACVSDTYDIFNAVENVWGTILKDEVVSSGTVLVIRPDSGDPVYVCSKLMRILGEKFGYTINSKGYKVLNNVRVIQGDGVNLHSIEAILKSLEADKFSADNISMGSGGFLTQQLDRDTQRFAMKASAIKVGDEWIGISKDPITDPGKASKAGRVTATIDSMGDIVTGNINSNLMQTVFDKGQILVDESLDVIRARSETYL